MEIIMVAVMIIWLVGSVMGQVAGWFDGPV